MGDLVPPDFMEGSTPGFVLPEVTASAGGGGGSIFPGIGSIVGGALGGIGSVISGLFAQSSAREQMRFQERMSSTAHQREVADLRAAGLNPILSATRGGSSSPGGAMAQMPNPGEDVGAGVSSSAKMMGIELPALESNIRLQAAQGEAQLASAESSRAAAARDLAEAGAVSSYKSVQDATAARINQLIGPEVGETLAHKALMEQQRRVGQASAKQIQAEEQLTRARIGKAEWESSVPGIALDSIGKAADAIPVGRAAKSVGQAVFGGPASGARVKAAIDAMKRRR